jgi:hypothetical protein
MLNEPLENQPDRTLHADANRPEEDRRQSAIESPATQNGIDLSRATFKEQALDEKAGTSSGDPRGTPPAPAGSMQITDLMKITGFTMLVGSLGALYFTPFILVPAAVAFGGILIGAAGDFLEKPERGADRA